MATRFHTLGELAEFYKNNSVKTFSVKEQGKSIAVHTPAFFEYNDNKTNDGLMHCRINVMHEKENENYSYIPLTAVTKALNTLAYKPILAYIHKLDSGQYAFKGHEIHTECGEDGIVTVYDEKQVGCFTVDEPILEYDEKKKRCHVIANGVIPELYTKAADIIRESGGTDVSCEIEINECHYDEENDYLVITDFVFTGVTLLGYESGGRKIQPAMENARLTIEDFSKENNGIKFNKQEMLEMREKIDTILSRFNNDSYGKEENSMDNNNETIFDQIDGNPEPEQNPAPEVPEAKETPEVQPEGEGAEPSVEPEVVQADEGGQGAEPEAEPTEYELLLKEFEEYKETHSHSNEEYDALETYKKNAEYDKEHAQKEEILNDEKYSVLKEVESFKKLIEEMDNYSVDELEKEAKIIFADYIVTLGDFSEPQTSVKLFAAVSRKDTADERYKNIFD